jgi:hypothetical protein
VIVFGRQILFRINDPDSFVIGLFCLQSQPTRLQVQADSTPMILSVGFGFFSILVVGGGGGVFLFNTLRTDLTGLESRLASKLEDKLTTVSTDLERKLGEHQKKIAKKIRKAFEEDDD